MPERRFRRARHQTVITALRAFDAEFLTNAGCCFAGGTRIVLELDEYRESEDVDFLCANREGYRALRGAVTDRSLGALLRTPLPLAREVRADRYGIRTFLDMGESKLKTEIVFEARIDIAAAKVVGVPVPCLDRVSCFAEKYLANADRGKDEATLHRDAVDLAFMIEAWGARVASRGAAIAREAYGRVVDDAAVAVAQRLLSDQRALKHSVAALRVTGVETLTAGLKKIGELAAGVAKPKQPGRAKAPRG